MLESFDFSFRPVDDDDILDQHYAATAARDVETIDYWKFHANKKNARAYYELGRMYQFALCGVTRDMSKVEEYYRKAVNLGFPPAWTALGHLLIVGIGSADLREGLSLLQKAADNGDAEAMATLGSMLLRGTFDSDDPELPTHYLRNASTAGNMDAHWELGQVGGL